MIAKTKKNSNPITYAVKSDDGIERPKRSRVNFYLSKSENSFPKEAAQKSRETDYAWLV